MRISYVTLGSLLLGSLLLSSCENCESPNVTPVTDTDAEWLVYDDPKDTIRFVDEAANVIEYVRTNVRAGNVPGKDTSFDDKCLKNLDSQILVSIEDIKRKSPGLETYILKKPDDLVVSLTVENIGTWEVDETKPTTEQEVNGKVYQHVYELLPTATQPAHVKRLLYTKADGFISIEFNNDKKLMLQQ